MSDTTINIPKSTHDGLMATKAQQDAELSSLRRLNADLSSQLRDKIGEIHRLQAENAKIHDFIRAFRELTMIADKRKGA